MGRLNELNEELRKIIGDTGTPIEVRAAKITDDLLTRYADIYDSNSIFQSVGDMAIKIKTSGATEGENGVMWGEVIRLVHQMLDL